MEDEELTQSEEDMVTGEEPETPVENLEDDTVSETENN